MKHLKKITGFTLMAASAFALGMMLFGLNGQAYIDPSAMTYIIQVVAGVIIAIGAAVGIYWRKAKKKVQDKLGVEEKKELESDEIIVKDEAAD